MSDTKKNALAELATNLIDAMTAIAETGLIADRHVDAISHAQRIVAELAKVRDTNWSAGYNYPEPNSSSVAISKCRAIAEEGVNNGK